MQVLYYVGCQEVYIVGMDHHFDQTGGPNKKQVMKGPDPNRARPAAATAAPNPSPAQPRPEHGSRHRVRPATPAAVDIHQQIYSSRSTAVDLQQL